MFVFEGQSLISDFCMIEHWFLINIGVVCGLLFSLRSWHRDDHFRTLLKHDSSISWWFNFFRVKCGSLLIDYLHYLVSWSFISMMNYLLSISVICHGILATFVLEQEYYSLSKLPKWFTGSKMDSHDIRFV